MQELEFLTFQLHRLSDWWLHCGDELPGLRNCIKDLFGSCNHNFVAATWQRDEPRTVHMLVQSDRPVKGHITIFFAMQNNQWRRVIFITRDKLAHALGRFTLVTRC